MQSGWASGITLGVAMAGFWDGISLHAILQWHHMISSKVPPVDMRAMHINMFADGLFDLFCWIVAAVGIALLFREGQRGELASGKTYSGWILIGAGGFNFLEGIVDHEVLGIHHVRPGPHWLAWDIGFLLIGGLLVMAIGGLLLRKPPKIAIVQRQDAA